MPLDSEPGSALADLMAHALRLGAHAADASLSARESVSVEVRLGELEGVEREEVRSVALRAFIGKQQAAASSSDVSPRALEALAERVVAMARAAPEDPFCGLLETPHRAGQFAQLQTADEARPSAEELEDMARACEAAALAIPGVANSAGPSSPAASVPSGRGDLPNTISTPSVLRSSSVTG